MFEVVKPLSRKQRDISFDSGENYAKPKSKRHEQKECRKKITTAERKIGSGGKPAHRPNFRRRFGSGKLDRVACLYWRSEATPLVIYKGTQGSQMSVLKQKNKKNNLIFIRSRAIKN